MWLADGLMNRSATAVGICWLMAGCLSSTVSRAKQQDGLDGNGAGAVQWPFRESRNQASFTQRQILEEAAPILLVAHDVSDGTWQFLDGGDVIMEDARVVGLGEIVKLDPSIAELSDLPLGFVAVREDRGAPWSRESQFPTRWNELVREAQLATEELQDALHQDFRIGDWDRFHYDQPTARFTLSKNGKPRVIANARIVGSLSGQTRTWLWSWGNKSVAAKASEGMQWLREFGEQQKLKKLAQPHWPADDVVAREVAAVACWLLEAEGIYRVPDSDGGGVFLVLDRVRWVKEG